MGNDALLSIHTRALLFILVSFEGPDRYSHAGGLGTRVTELSSALACHGFETHLFFIGDPTLPGHEERHGGNLHLHRWCQWISAYHSRGVYDGEEGKHYDLTRSLPSWLLEHIIRPASGSGRLVVVMGEDWQIADTLCHLGEAVRAEHLSGSVLLLWNANHVFGFSRIAWEQLRRHAVITTVSRYMKHVLERLGVDALVVPNGIPDRWLQPVNARAVREMRQVFRGKLLLVKVARWDPDKGWGIALEASASRSPAVLEKTMRSTIITPSSSRGTTPTRSSNRSFISHAIRWLDGACERQVRRRQGAIPGRPFFSACFCPASSNCSSI